MVQNNNYSFFLFLKQHKPSEKTFSLYIYLNITVTVVIALYNHPFTLIQPEDY